ncbi:hypothetical protein DV515_00013958 [Chloebia gouldiae]|uniref:Uncharacterized protein n=1 Tax=Chloebia gouldiae TaxID=44316 RepID=A0A3L8RZH0_CHLGU|nr:hypothetical protein DV515_00013958 [Chloebia gouldiae]
MGNVAVCSGEVSGKESSGKRGSPPTTSTSSSSLTNEVPKQPVSRDLASVRPSATSVGVQYTPHSHQFPRTRKMFDKGPEQVVTPVPSPQTADDGDDAVGHKNFISAAVQTGFCDWSAKYFAQPVMKLNLLAVVKEEERWWREAALGEASRTDPLPHWPQVGFGSCALLPAQTPLTYRVSRNPSWLRAVLGATGHRKASVPAVRKS